MCYVIYHLLFPLRFCICWNEVVIKFPISDTKENRHAVTLIAIELLIFVETPRGGDGLFFFFINHKLHIMDYFICLSIILNVSLIHFNVSIKSLQGLSYEMYCKGVKKVIKRNKHYIFFLYISSRVIYLIGERSLSLKPSKLISSC